MKRTIRDIEYQLNLWGGARTIIPAGTPVVPADNLPQPNQSKINYWVEPWKGMTAEERSHQRTYGFGVSSEDVTK